MFFSLIEYSLALLFVLLVVFTAWQLICIFALKIVNPVLVMLGSRTVAPQSCRNSLSWVNSAFDWVDNIHLPSRPLPEIDINLSPNMSLIVLVVVLATALALTLKMLSDLLGKMNFSFSGFFDAIIKIFAGMGVGRFIDELLGRHGKMPKRYPKRRRLKANSIFISYRRKDSADSAGRMYERLAYHYGKTAVFLDNPSIPKGVDFDEFLEGAVRNCKVLLCVIGGQWLEADPVTGKSRLENEGDFVRLEIETALQNHIPIIPLAVHGADFPTADKLPDSLKRFPYKNGLKIRPDDDFQQDMTRLIKAIDAILMKKV
jgi:hypothetical protein